MERVLKRVGLSKRTQPEPKTQNANEPEERVKVRRRRRSKSRRRSNKETKKTRGLFNIDWESVKECKSCKSRAITRRFCSKRCDNELYRSNSFKFERFVRGNDEISTLGKKVSYKVILQWFLVNATGQLIITTSLDLFSYCLIDMRYQWPSTTLCSLIIKVCMAPLYYF